MNELHKNFHSIQINITPHTFAGLAKQNMAFHQGVMELCGNAIAAALPGEKALIFIGLAPGSAKDELLLVVADWGSGMDLSQLENALQLGSLPTGSNRLNGTRVRHQQRPGQPGPAVTVPGPCTPVPGVLPAT